MPDPTLVTILQRAVPIYRDRLLVQWDALSQNKQLPKEVLDCGAKGSRIGWQLNGFMGAGPEGGSGCIYPPFVICACKNLKDFQEMLDYGINSGGRYFEIQIQNANAKFAPAFRAAHKHLEQVTSR